jgi:hypothetical protein
MPRLPKATLTAIDHQAIEEVEPEIEVEWVQPVLSDRVSNTTRAEVEAFCRKLLEHRGEDRWAILPGTKKHGNTYAGAQNRASRWRQRKIKGINEVLHDAPLEVRVDYWHPVDGPRKYRVVARVP